jgi:hypothetical protein
MKAEVSAKVVDLDIESLAKVTAALSSEAKAICSDPPDITHPGKLEKEEWQQVHALEAYVWKVGYSNLLTWTVATAACVSRCSWTTELSLQKFIKLSWG